MIKMKWVTITMILLSVFEENDLIIITIIIIKQIMIRIIILIIHSFAGRDR